jgi:hypothetical protein
MYQDIIKIKGEERGPDFSSLFREGNVEGYKRRRWRTKAIETK